MNNPSAVDVIFTGKVVFGADPRQAAAELARLTGLHADQALAVITGGQPRLAMQGLTPEHGRAWLSRLTMIGVEARLEASNKPSSRSFGPPPADGKGPASGGGGPVGFGEAIAVCLKKYANCGGRASRSEFWWFKLFQTLVCLVPYLLAMITDQPLILIPAALAALVLVIPDLAVQIRRLHDQDKSGWFLLLGVIPVVGGLILTVMYMLPGTPGTNRFDGQGPSYAGVFIALGLAFLAGVLLLTAIAIPQFGAYRMRAFNASAENDLIRLKVTEEMLMADHRVYGATREGKLPGSGGGKGDVLTGPLDAAEDGVAGAMVSGGVEGGEARGVGLSVGHGVSVAAGSDTNSGGTMVFYAVSKHKEGNRVFLTTSETTSIYYCQNDLWIGKSGIPVEAVLDFFTSSDIDPEGQKCNGSPIGEWQAL